MLVDGAEVVTSGASVGAGAPFGQANFCRLSHAALLTQEGHVTFLQGGAGVVGSDESPGSPRHSWVVAA